MMMMIYVASAIRSGRVLLKGVRPELISEATVLIILKNI